MMLLQPFLLCILPLVSSQAIVTVGPVNASKHLLSDDLPEDYHVATVSSEVDATKGTSALDHVVGFNPTSPLPEVTVTITPVEDNFIGKNESAVKNVNVVRVQEDINNATPPSPIQILTAPVTVPVPEVFEKTSIEPIIDRRMLTESYTEELVTKPRKLHKKLVITRQKTTTERAANQDSSDSEHGNELKSNSSSEEINLSNIIVKLKQGSINSSMNEDIKKPIESSKTSTTEKYDTTSSLVFSSLQRLVNNNVQNVIDTSISPISEGITETSVGPLPAKNARFETNEYGSTGQTDWVPIISTRGSGSDWVPSFSPAEAKLTAQKLDEDAKAALTLSNNSTLPESTTRIPRSTTFSSSLSLNPNVSDSKDTTEWVNKDNDTFAVTDELNLPVEGATLTLATSFYTRKPQRTTETTLTGDIAYEESMNNSLPHRRTDITFSNPNSTIVKTETNSNVSKEHNQVLKNTIPDSVIVETTPTDFKWRPVFTVAPPTQNTTDNSKTQTVSPGTMTMNKTTEENITPVTENDIDIERTVAYEILKVTPQNIRSSSDFEGTTEVVVSSTTVPEQSSVKPHTPEDSETTEPIIVSTDHTMERTHNVTESSVAVTSTESLNITLASTSLTSKPKSIESSSSNPVMNESQTPAVAPVAQSETTVHEYPSTTEIDSTTIILPEEEEKKTEKTDDDNRTFTSNETSAVEDSFETFGGEITEESVPAYLRLTVQTSELELCHLLPELRAAILKMLSEGTQTNVSSEFLVFLNLNPTRCHPVLKEDRPDDSEVRLRPVNMFLMDSQGDFNKNLSEAFLTLWGHAGLDFPLPILKVDFVTPIVEGEMPEGVGGGVVAAIVISCVAGLCLILLGILFVIIKRRQKKFNYGQRCTPVSLDAYSLDSVSIRNSNRRKDIRASKRSYGNAAFDDPDIPSHPMNFAGLANFSSEKDQLHEEFAVIPQVSPRAEELPPGVETRNRYANVLPLPETRVILSPREGDPLSDYINANYVRGLNGAEKTYIAAQAPLASTVADWWRMIWENQVRVVLMLTALQENGVEKCADYLPPNEVTDNLRLFGDFQVTLKKRDVKEKYIVSTLQLKNMETNLWREVKHLWYLGWPESGVPAEPNSLIAFLIEARSQLKTSSGATTPTLVHCSPGTGRTGTVIACDLCIREFEQKRLVDIPRCVFFLRRARAGAVQTREQYSFIYQVLNTYATKLTGGVLETI